MANQSFPDKMCAKFFKIKTSFVINGIKYVFSPLSLNLLELDTKNVKKCSSYAQNRAKSSESPSNAEYGIK